METCADRQRIRKTKKSPFRAFLDVLAKAGERARSPQELRAPKQASYGGSTPPNTKVACLLITAVRHKRVAQRVGSDNCARISVAKKYAEQVRGGGKGDGEGRGGEGRKELGKTERILLRARAHGHCRSHSV